jgi:hypothetical protein
MPWGPAKCRQSVRNRRPLPPCCSAATSWSSTPRRSRRRRSSARMAAGRASASSRTKASASGRHRAGTRQRGRRQQTARILSNDGCAAAVNGNAGTPTSTRSSSTRSSTRLRAPRPAAPRQLFERASPPSGRSTVRRLQGGGRAQRAATRRPTRLADPGVRRRVTPINRIRRGAVTRTQPHAPPDSVRRPAEKQAAASHRDLPDHMARRVAAHRYDVPRDNTNDQARGHHQPKRHARSIARRRNTTKPARLSASTRIQPSTARAAG